MNAQTRFFKEQVIVFKNDNEERELVTNQADELADIVVHIANNYTLNAELFLQRFINDIGAALDEMQQERRLNFR